MELLHTDSHAQDDNQAKIKRSSLYMLRKTVWMFTVLLDVLGEHLFEIALKRGRCLFNLLFNQFF